MENLQNTPTQDEIQEKYNMLWENRFKEKVPEPYLKKKPRPVVQIVFSVLSILALIACAYKWGGL
jgi:hypothetical protein